MIHPLTVRVWHTKTKTMHWAITLFIKAKRVRLGPKMRWVDFRNVKLMRFTGVYDRSSYDHHRLDPFWAKTISIWKLKKKDWLGCPIFQGDIVEGEVSTHLKPSPKARTHMAQFSVGVREDGSFHLVPLKPLPASVKRLPSITEVTVVGHVYQ